MSSVATTIAPLVSLVDLVKTVDTHYSGTIAGKLTALAGASGDDTGQVEAWAKDERNGRNVYAEFLANCRTPLNEIAYNLAVAMDYGDIKPGASADIVFGKGLRRWVLDTDGDHTIDNAAAVDKGDGTVGIPITGHGFRAGKFCTIAGTSNYDDDYEIESQTTNEIVITATYAAETFAGTETCNGHVPLFKSRNVTHNAVSALSGTGTGSLIMHTTDAYSYTLEATTEETLHFACTSDVGAGTSSGREEFSWYGEREARDLLEHAGCGDGNVLTSIDAANVSAISNASLGQAFSGTGTDKVPGWTITGTASYVVAETTTIYRQTQALKWTDMVKLSQVFTGLSTTRPTIFSVMYDAATGSADGKLYLRAGSASTNVADLSAASAGYQRLYMVKWPREWSGGGSDIEIEWTDRTTGTLYVSEVVIHTMTRIGGRYFAILAGDTDFVIEDTWTQQSTITGDGYNKEWLHRMLGLQFELPHGATASPGFEDPS